MVPPLLDSSGLARSKSAIVMDLGNLNFPNPKSVAALRFNGKSTQAPTPAPVAFGSTVVDSVLVHRDPDSAVSPVSLPVTEAPVEAISVVKDASPTSGSSWAKVIATGLAPHSLKFVEPIFTDDQSTISIPPELLAIGRKKYSLCLIGQFMGTAPKIGLIHTIANMLWGRVGAISVSKYKDDLFLFQFPNESAYSRALHRGPWHVGGIPLLLSPWSSSFQKLDSSSAVFPVWVKFKNVPLELLTHEGLSYIASAVGTPMHTDQDCSKLFRDNCANVCIKVDFSQPLKHELPVDINGERMIIDIAYSWKPQWCAKCRTWGHHELLCPNKKSLTQWVKKVTFATGAAVSNPLQKATGATDLEISAEPGIDEARTSIANNTASIEY
ncbi:hypothetical protein Tsubulata_033137 [Turnera subulata]|uniref:DUF4283 domain-containing protein n=1 Tax=Turnera subulata TaxID=218843 RepID=A0A9Q0F4F1_9ROSI|nr:hypothetical protein Tsubulata_033137 [Turnera subulata]